MPYFVRLDAANVIRSSGSTDAEALASMQEAEGDAVVQVAAPVLGAKASAIIGQIFDRATGTASPAPLPSE